MCNCLYNTYSINPHDIPKTNNNNNKRKVGQNSSLFFFIFYVKVLLEKDYSLSNLSNK